MTYPTALDLSGQIARREISAVGLMQATLARIAAVNPGVNAIVSLRDGDALLAGAAAADQTPRNGWMHGIPFAVKESGRCARFADPPGLACPDRQSRGQG